MVVTIFNFARAVGVGVVFAGLSLFAASAGATSVELAARPDPTRLEPIPGDGGALAPTSRRQSGVSILKLQRALAQIGLYLGPEDGHLNDDTVAAIRIYQQGAGMKIDGRVTPELWDLLQNAVRVRALLRRLKTARETGKDKAREALLNHPATRDLVTADTVERADPTRDANACFDQPTARCLLDEAAESVKAVFRPEMRDWALGEILAAQARAGLIGKAMDTARRIRDPRLIMVALRDIAEAEAAAGLHAEALEAARTIPDTMKLVEAFVAIAEILSRRGETEAARQVLNEMAGLLGETSDAIKRVSFLTKAAVILSRGGDRDGAGEHLKKAEAEARKQLAAADKAAALRYVASAMADMEQPQQALTMLGEIDSKSERISVLVRAATAQARAGDAAAALATADTIEAVRFRAVVLGGIAKSQAELGQIEDAHVTLDLALAAIDQIKVPYARSFATSRVALAMVQLVRAESAASPRPSAHTSDSQPPLSPMTYRQAADTAGRIDDNRLRAQTLWAIAAVQRRAGEDAGADATEVLAERATDAIISRLSRVWMYCELAETHARRNRSEEAWRAFQHGIEAIRIIDNPWGRGRALARLATTLIEIVDPRPSRLAPSER